MLFWYIIAFIHNYQLVRNNKNILGSIFMEPTTQWYIFSTGVLILKKDKLEYIPKSFGNIKTIEINQIVSVKVYCRWFAFCDGLQITVKNGQKEKFIVPNRKIWKQKIEELMRTKPVT